MKVTAIYVYPVKALRGIRLEEARLGPQGVEHDRRFMLCRVRAGGELQTVNLAANPACGLFAQELAGDEIHVRYRPDGDGDEEPLRIPLRPETAALARARVDLHHSLVMAHRMGAPYDGWFSARFGFETALVFIGDGRRPVLGTFAPQEEQEQPEQDGGREDRDEAAWLAFSDVAPFLVTSERSLADVSARLPGPGGMDMRNWPSATRRPSA
ncbi:hypothetical protein CDD83_1728 [Cordyceps sp. RAO-2017]|nr:hypothetical protein CDD83_1728 [Cordyceps sp. RAO-2017]